MLLGPHEPSPVRHWDGHWFAPWSCPCCAERTRSALGMPSLGGCTGLVGPRGGGGVLGAISPRLQDRQWPCTEGIAHGRPRAELDMAVRTGVDGAHACAAHATREARLGQGTALAAPLASQKAGEQGRGAPIKKNEKNKAEVHVRLQGSAFQMQTLTENKMMLS